MQKRLGNFSFAYGNNRYVRYWPDDVRAKVLEARRWEVDAWAKDRTIDPALVQEVAGNALRLGRIPELGGLGLSYDDSEALAHFVKNTFLNMESVEEDGALCEASNVVIVNNTGKDIRIVRPHIMAYAKTGEIHDDIADLFSLTKRKSGGKVKVIVNWLDEDHDCEGDVLDEAGIVNLGKFGPKDTYSLIKRFLKGGKNQKDAMSFGGLEITDGALVKYGARGDVPVAEWGSNGVKLVNGKTKMGKFWHPHIRKVAAKAKVRLSESRESIGEGYLEEGYTAKQQLRRVKQGQLKGERLITGGKPIKSFAGRRGSFWATVGGEAIAGAESLKELWIMLADAKIKPQSFKNTTDVKPDFLRHISKEYGGTHSGKFEDCESLDESKLSQDAMLKQAIAFAEKYKKSYDFAESLTWLRRGDVKQAQRDWWHNTNPLRLGADRGKLRKPQYKRFGFMLGLLNGANYVKKPKGVWMGEATMPPKAMQKRAKAAIETKLKELEREYRVHARSPGYDEKRKKQIDGEIRSWRLHLKKGHWKADAETILVDLGHDIDESIEEADTRKGSYTSRTTKKSFPFARKKAHYAKATDDALHYARKDAYEAMKAADSMGDEIASGYYQDEIHTVNAEMKKRGIKPRRLKEGVSLPPPYEMPITEYKPEPIEQAFVDQFNSMVMGMKQHPDRILDKNALPDAPDAPSGLKLKTSFGTRLNVEYAQHHGDPIQANASQPVSGLVEARSKMLKKDLKLKSGVKHLKGTQVTGVAYREVGHRWVADLSIGGSTVSISPARLHVYVSGFPKPPTIKTMEKQDQTGNYKSVSGKRAYEMDGTSEDGAPTWMLALGYV
jgi:hypothetical protein